MNEDTCGACGAPFQIDFGIGGRVTGGRCTAQCWLNDVDAYNRELARRIEQP